MNIERLRYLLDRFYDGISTQEEEQELMRAFCEMDIVPDDLKADKILFSSMAKSRDNESDIPAGLESRLMDKVDEWEAQEAADMATKTPTKVIGMRSWNMRLIRDIAAIAIVVFGIGFIALNGSRNEEDLLCNKDTYTDVDEAYERSQKALLMFSQTIEKGERNIGMVEDKASSIMGKLDKYMQ